MGYLYCQINAHEKDVTCGRSGQLYYGDFCSVVDGRAG